MEDWDQDGKLFCRVRTKLIQTSEKSVKFFCQFSDTVLFLDHLSEKKSMIQSLVHARKISYSVQSRTQRTASSPAGAKEAFAIDLNKLFTPAERKTLANIKEHARDQGLSEIKNQEIEGSVITSKYGEKSISHDIPIKEILGRQIRGIKDGYGDGSGPSLTFLQDIYNNFHKFQAVDIICLTLFCYE